MTDHAGLTLEERQEIDGFFDRLTSNSHYDLLGVARSADPEAIRHAYNARTRRFHPRSFSGQIPATYEQKLSKILAKLDEANTVLGDPVRRYLYDQELATRGASGPSTAKPPANKGTPLPTSSRNPFASESRRTPAPGSLGSPSQPVRPATTKPTPMPVSSKPTPTPGSSSPRGHSLPATDPLAPIDKAPSRPGFRPPTPPYGSRNANVPISPSPGVSQASAEAAPADERVQALETQVSMLQGEVATLLAEVERLAVSVQLAIAFGLEPDGVKPEQLVSAGQALVSTRVVMATLLARREEQAGRWEAASALWQRAARARPGEVMLLVRAADALRKAGTDLYAAEAIARQAIQMDPDCAEAHAALAVIETRRRNAL